MLKFLFPFNNSYLRKTGCPPLKDINQIYANNKGKCMNKKRLFEYENTNWITFQNCTKSSLRLTLNKLYFLRTFKTY